MTILPTVHSLTISNSETVIPHLPTYLLPVYWILCEIEIQSSSTVAHMQNNELHYNTFIIERLLALVFFLNNGNRLPASGSRKMFRLGKEIKIRNLHGKSYITFLFKTPHISSNEAISFELGNTSMDREILYNKY